jgi:predicted nucleotidyltransferase
MKRLSDIDLSPSQSEALDQIQQGLLENFSIEAIVLYGSVARGEADEESDIDLLIITTHALERHERHRITELIFETNLRHETNFSSLVADRASWESGLYSVLPIRQNIERDGVLI